MSLWTANLSIGAHWSRDGRCRAVKIDLRGDGLRIEKIWQSPPSDSLDISSTLPEALRHLGGNEAVKVVAGGPDENCAVRDVRLPKLGGQDLRNALLFELRKQCPLPADRLVWGFRIVPGSGHGNSQTVRLFYLRDAEWTRWVENVSGLTRSLDALMPARLALDPAFSTCGVRLGDTLAVAPPDAEGVRADASGADGSSPVLGDGETPLQVPRLALGPLAELPIAEQRAFVPAIVLAANALLGDLSRDRRNLPPFPDELLPKRNRLSKAVATLLALYLLLMVGLWAGMSLNRSLGYHERLRVRMAAVQERINELESRRDSSDIEQAISESLKQIAPELPTLTEVIAELTDILPPEFWLARMSWTAGRIEIEVRGQNAELGFVQALEDSPILKEVELIDKRVDARGDLVSARIRLSAEGSQPALPSESAGG